MTENTQGSMLPDNTARESSTGENREKGIKQDCNYRGRARLFNWAGLAGGLMLGVVAIGYGFWNRENPPPLSPEQVQQIVMQLNTGSGNQPLSPEQIQQIKDEVKNKFVEQLDAEMEDPKLYQTKFGRVVHNQRITMSGLCDLLIMVSKGSKNEITRDNCFSVLDQQYHAQGGQ